MEAVQLALNSTAAIPSYSFPSSDAATEFIIKVNYEIYGLGQQGEGGGERADFYEGRVGFWAIFCPGRRRPRPSASVTKEGRNGSLKRHTSSEPCNFSVSRRLTAFILARIKKPSNQTASTFSLPSFIVANCRDGEELGERHLESNNTFPYRQNIPRGVSYRSGHPTG